MIKVVDGEPLPAPAPRPTNGGDDRGKLKLLFLMGLLLVFVGGPGLRAAVGRFPAAAIIGAVTGFFAWWIAASLFAAAAVGIIAFELSLFSGLHQAMRGGPGGPGGWGGGGWSGGGGGSWGGGGGGFGGGGASGRW